MQKFQVSLFASCMTVFMTLVVQILQCCLGVGWVAVSVTLSVCGNAFVSLELSALLSDLPFSCTATVQGFCPPWDRMRLSVHAHPVLLEMRLPAFLFLSHPPNTHTHTPGLRPRSWWAIYRARSNRRVNELCINKERRIFGRILRNGRAGSWFKLNSVDLCGQTLWVPCLFLMLVDKSRWTVWSLTVNIFY